MAKQLTINDLYAVKEDRFKQTKTYQTKAPVDSRWYLIETPSNKDVRFTDVINSEEVNLMPQPFIILADNERIELQGEVVKQEHIVDTDEVFDDVVKNVVPEVDYTGNITRYREEYKTKSHYEQQDYMRYTISYSCSISQLRVIASASKVECMLYDRELASETCKVIQGGAQTVCYLLGDQNYEKDLKTIIGVHNKKDADRQKKERREKALKQQKQNRLNALNQQYSVINTLRAINYVFGIVCLLGTVVTYAGKEINSDYGNSGYGEYPNAESYMTWFILGFGLAICLAIFNICKIKSLEREASEIKL